jgi:tRNA(Ile)-lysidine synthase
VALTHHADDQIELFFLRLLRGTSGMGLAGMRWISPSPCYPGLRLVRPLLDQPKAALRAYAQEAKIPFREDATNAQLDLLRNRVRHELLPMLTERYQPALGKTILRLMETVGAESELVQQTAQHWLSLKSRPPFAELHAALQRQSLQVQLIGLGIEPAFGLIEQLRSGPDQPVTVAPDLVVWRDASGMLHQDRGQETAFKAASLPLDLSVRQGEVVFGRRRISWQISLLPQIQGRWTKARIQEAFATCADGNDRCDMSDAKALGLRPSAVDQAARAESISRQCGQEFFDADAVGELITLRHWQPGDRFWPTGMPGPAKVQDLLINRKIPRAERRQLVVATTAKGELFWVEGLRMAESFKLDRRTRRCLKWEWQCAPGARGEESAV